MYIAAGVLAALTALFYAAGHHEIGSIGADVCQYGGMFCDNPQYSMIGAILAAIWGKFVSMH